jgi:hypothetical protein
VTSTQVHLLLEQAIAVVALNIADDQVQTIHAVANPEKLHHLGRSPRGVRCSVRGRSCDARLPLAGRRTPA